MDADEARRLTEAVIGAGQVRVARHPLIDHKLTLMRSRETPAAEFRRLLREISAHLAYEATRDLATETTTIETPLETMEAPQLAGRKPCLVSVMRAGNGMLEGMLDIIPAARVGHLGLRRDEATLTPVRYFTRLPWAMDERLTLLLDPMLATGNTASDAIDQLKAAGSRRLRFVCLVAAPEGIAALTGRHPDVPVLTAAIDRCIDGNGYIHPGLGDAGDRLYGLT